MVAGVSLVDVSKTFLDGKRAVSPLKDLSLTVQPGKLTTVLGKSGCGKTTLLKVICGLEKIDSGKIQFFRDDGSAFEDPKISLVFQDPRLLPWKSVRENLELAIRTLPAAEQEKRVNEVLELVQLSGTADLYPAQLSGGMAQRIGLARGIISRPDLLLLDEPFGALDFMTRSKLQMDFSKIQTELETTMLLITHDINEAVLLSDDIAFMRDGKIAESLDINLPKPRRYGDTNLSQYQKQLFNFFI
ncbi:MULTISPECIES: ABC transporter ATP-binding protein [Sutterellaceae]|uniref:ABC transporter ATP-binding protein n=1 Tax=Sutterellaceae TaxID=995019 RepID=UPI00203DBA1E|nr:MULTISPECIES: ATP-binding cassette domain-containing protein [Sutterellaceae]